MKNPIGFIGPMMNGPFVLLLTMLTTASGAETPTVKALESAETLCRPTESDHLGPMYKPDAPVRSKVGEGYVLEGVVKSSIDCNPISGARIELWLANPDGSYDDQHRATVHVNEWGAYRFESNFPPSYSGRPSHIHVRVTAPGYKTLVTQHYTKAGDTRATFDLVLVPDGS